MSTTQSSTRIPEPQQQQSERVAPVHFARAVRFTILYTSLETGQNSARVGYLAGFEKNERFGRTATRLENRCTRSAAGAVMIRRTLQTRVTSSDASLRVLHQSSSDGGVAPGRAVVEGVLRLMSDVTILSEPKSMTALPVELQFLAVEQQHFAFQLGAIASEFRFDDDADREDDALGDDETTVHDANGDRTGDIVLAAGRHHFDVTEEVRSSVRSPMLSAGFACPDRPIAVDEAVGHSFVIVADLATGTVSVFDFVDQSNLAARAGRQDEKLKLV